MFSRGEGAFFCHLQFHFHLMRGAFCHVFACNLHIIKAYRFNNPQSPHLWMLLIWWCWSMMKKTNNKCIRVCVWKHCHFDVKWMFHYEMPNDLSVSSILKIFRVKSDISIMITTFFKPKMRAEIQRQVYLNDSINISNQLKPSNTHTFSSIIDFFKWISVDSVNLGRFLAQKPLLFTTWVIYHTCSHFVSPSADASELIL